MRPEDPTGDGAAGDAPPWSAAFDPAANVRALTELQRNGLEAAQVLIERFIQTMDSRASADRARPTGPPQGVDGPAAGIDGLVDLWADLVKSALRGFLTQIATNPAGPPAAGPDDPVRMLLERTDGQPARGSAPMWLHNTSSTGRDQLRPHCGELRSAAGAQLQAHVTFDPPVVAALGPGSSELVTVRVEDADGAPGSYRGVVLVAGLDDLWLNLEVVVP